MHSGLQKSSAAFMTRFARLIYLASFFVFISASFSLAQVCQEGEERPCGYPDVGECEPGKQLCQNGYWSQCYGGNGPSDEICFDNRDNDCDGTTDENCVCVEGSEESCGPETTVGPCEKGARTCHNNQWSSCEGAIYPLPGDLCNNNIDDDCDDEIDEGCQQQQTENNSTTCFNNIQDGDEADIDCGGSCRACISCLDSILNQGETRAHVDLGSGNFSDCGGPRCPACPTCLDDIQNQGEMGVDCGGPCALCEKKINDDDKDGVSNEREMSQGTNPLLADTDGDGLDDLTDISPLCPNGFCDVLHGEDENVCPQDCKKKVNFLAPIIIFSALFFILLLLYFIGRKKRPQTQKTNNQNPTSKIFDMERYQALQTKQNSKKEKPNELDKALERSLDNFDKFLKK